MSVRYRYGTSGFRYGEHTMLDIGVTIGRAIGVLIVKSNHNRPYPKNMGLMITASHNPYTDNGIKMVDDKGNMIGYKEEHDMERVVNGEDIEEMLKPYSKNNLPNGIKLIIGTDTRRTCSKLKCLICQGVKEVIDRLSFIDLGCRTTPEFHVCVVRYNGLSLFESTDSDIHHDNTHGFDDLVLSHSKDTFYCRYMKSMIQQYGIDMRRVWVDCANGVGALTMGSLGFGYIKSTDCYPELINVDTKNHQKLNNRCGSEFVMTDPKDYYQELAKGPRFSQRFGKLGASFDGDADRIVFYYYDENDLKVMTGDHIGCLILRYIVERLKGVDLENHKLRVGIVHTGYSNGGYIEYAESLNQKLAEDNQNVEITCSCVAIGVKNLIQEAKKFDIGIYYESNGHGSVLVNKHYGIPELMVISRLFNSIVGDAIANLIGVLYILKEMGINAKDFYKLFTIRHSETVKVKVHDKNRYVVSKNQTILVSPVDTVRDIEHIMSQEKFKGCRAFVRPSGTEDILRLYVENNPDNTTDLSDIIKSFEQILE